MTGQASAAGAARFKVLSPVALKKLLLKMQPPFEQAGGPNLDIVWGESGSIKGDIEKGVPFDVAIMTPAFVDEMIGRGKLDGATRTLVARSGMGVAIRKGAQKPDLGSVEAFKRTLAAARSIGFVEQSASSRYLAELFARLGIMDAIKSKLKPLPGPAGEFVAEGEPEIALTQISAILQFDGVEVAGPLPAEVQLYTTFAAAASPTADAAQARAVLAALVAPENADALKASGLDRPA